MVWAAVDRLVGRGPLIMWARVQRLLGRYGWATTNYNIGTMGDWLLLY